MSDKVQQCTRCGAAIVFLKMKPSARTPDPKPNPIDRESSPNGNLLVSWGTSTYQVVSKAELEKVKELPKPPPLHTSHFVTCRFAKNFRR
jgi:hypothetical protein